jgi:deoxyribonuclease-4
MDRHSEQLLVGAHTSTAGGLHNALLEGQKIGATTVQIFTSNQRQWKGRILTNDIIENWQRTLKETGLKQIMSHDSYLINLGTSNLEALEKSRQAFSEELQRCQQLDIPYLNFHPGAAVGSPVEDCLDRIVDSLLILEPQMQNGQTVLLLECTAGQGTAVGYRFEHLGYILQGVKGKIPAGVCIDTCHAFVAGYDIRTTEGWESTLAEFDKEVGLSYLKAFHINDSLKDLGSRVDRHAELGQGKIGWDAFKFLVTDKRTRHLPMYLETPGGLPCWEKEIAQLKEFAK